jgi:hypothetical protein
LFTVELDFDAATFNGEARRLEVDVRIPARSGDFTTLSPRLPLTAAPHSLQTRGIFVRDSGKVGIGTTSSTDAILDIEGDMVINFNDVLLRAGADRIHGLGWYGAGKPFDESTPDSPVLYGFNSEITNLKCEIRYTGETHHPFVAPPTAR